MNLSSPFILRPIATSLLMLAIFLCGILAYPHLPIASLPEVDYPTIQIATLYPGANADVMATSITAPLERQFGQIAGLTEMTSKSSMGASIITLQFNLSMDLDIAQQDVQAAINAASNFLPNDLPNPPIYSKVNPADAPILTLALTSQTLPLPTVEDYAESYLAQKISQISGVGLVTTSGGNRPAVRVQVNLPAIASFGLTLEDIRSAIVAANVNAAKGSFDGPRLAYAINANDQLLKAEDYAPLIISYKNNAPIYLRDIAKISNGVENTMLAAWMNNEPAIILNIQRQPGSNVIQVVDRIQKLLPQLKTMLPAGIKVNILSDRTQTIRSSIADVQFELILAVLLVILVIFLFLHTIRATIIPSMSIPLTIIGTFSIMYLCNFSLNNLTLMALTVATGFIVDDAIVMIENITRFIEEGLSPINAALAGAKQIGFTILSLSAALIAVLIPMFFMGDIVGRLFREFALTLSTAVVISAFISLTLTPMLCALLLKDIKQPSRFKQYADILFQRILAFYKETLHTILNHQLAIIIIFLCTIFLSLLLTYFIPKGFFPVQDSSLIQAITEARQTTSFEAMAIEQQKIAQIILANPSVSNLSSLIGIDATNNTLNSGRMLISLKPLTERDNGITDIINQLSQKIRRQSTTAVYMQPIQDLTLDMLVSRTQYQLSVTAVNNADATLWASKLQQALNHLQPLQDVASDAQNVGLQTYVNVDRESAARFGINLQLIDDILYDAYGQRQISTMFTQKNQYRVILEADPLFNNFKLNNLFFLNQNDSNAQNQLTQIPLNEFSTITQQNAPAVIERQGQFPSVMLSFNLAPNATLGEAINAINQAITDLQIPPSVQIKFEGTASIFQTAFSNEAWLVLAAIIALYIVLGILYESFIHPFTILSTLPSASLGALIALYVTGNELSLIALIGIILLIGIVMKNAIIMIDFALEQERIYQKSPEEAIYQAALLRFRPIMMTTIASLFGALPLAFANGIGSEFRNPLGIAIIGGLIVSQLLTLYSTPVIYLVFDKLYLQLRSYFPNNPTAVIDE